MAGGGWRVAGEGLFLFASASRRQRHERGPAMGPSVMGPSAARHATTSYPPLYVSSAALHATYTARGSRANEQLNMDSISPGNSALPLASDGFMK